MEKKTIFGKDITSPNIPTEQSLLHHVERGDKVAIADWERRAGKGEVMRIL